MDYPDPISQCQFELTEVFAFAPSEFEIKPAKLFWKAPCYIGADLILSPRTAAAQERFALALCMGHKIDAFARVSWEDQLWKTFSQRLGHISGPHANEWLSELLECHRRLKAGLQHTETIFQEPFHFVGREGFAKVDLPTILRENPENLCIYLALEKGSYCDYMFLRIHSSPPFFGNAPRRLWFEKRLPDGPHGVYREDVLPWFIATIARLPKKHQVPSLEPWTQRLLHFEPQLALPNGTGKPWSEKPPVVMVLGPTVKVGYRSLTHFKRGDISLLVRQGELVKIQGKERFDWRGGESMEFERTFYLLAFDEVAAERVERQIMLGRRIHFGLDAEVLGMICDSGGDICAINAPEETICRLCVPPGRELRPYGNPREKLKCYHVRSPGEPSYL